MKETNSFKIIINTFNLILVDLIESGWDGQKVTETILWSQLTSDLIL